MRVQEPAKYAEPIIGSRPPRFVSVNFDHWFFYEKAGGPFTEELILAAAEIVETALSTTGGDSDI